jgi:hypothetical protein
MNMFQRLSIYLTANRNYFPNTVVTVEPGAGSTQLTQYSSAISDTHMLFLTLSVPWLSYGTTLFQILVPKGFIETFIINFNILNFIISFLKLSLCTLNLSIAWWKLPHSLVCVCHQPAHVWWNKLGLHFISAQLVPWGLQCYSAMVIWVRLHADRQSQWCILCMSGKSLNSDFSHFATLKSI